MNDLGMMLLAGAARCLLLALLGVAICAASRRRGPATVALAAQATLTALVVVGALAPLSWPRWWVIQAPGTAVAGPVATPPQAARKAEVTASSTESSSVSAGPVATSVEKDADDVSWVSIFVEEFGAALRRPPEVERTGSWRWPAWVAAVYLAGASAMLARLAMGLRAVGAVRRRARSIDDPGLLDLIEGLRADLGMGSVAMVEARESAEVGTPATVGWRRPVLLLPTDWREWGEAERRAVVAHELAHVRRGDYAAGVWAQFCVAIHFYQPMAHGLAVRLRLHQELAADAWGATLSGGNRPYLHALARLAMRRDDRPAAWPARAFFPVRGTLTRRIEMLRDAKTTGDLSPRRRTLALTFGTLAAAGLFLAGLCGPLDPQSAIAQERPAGKPATDAAGAFDLSLVPSDAGMVIAVRPAELVALPEFKPMAALIGPESALIKRLGVAPEKVEQVTFVWLRLDGLRDAWNPSAVIVRAGDEDLKTLAAHFVGRTEELEYAGQKNIQRAGSDGPSCAWIDGRTLVISPTTSDLIRYLAARLNPIRQHAWDDAWESIRKGQAAMAIDAAFLVQFIEPNRPGLGAAPVGMVSPLWLGAHAHALGVDVTKGLALDFASACNSDDDDGAGKVARTLEALTTLAGNALPGLRPRGAEPPPGTPQAVLRERLQVAALLDVANDLLRSAKVERDGRTVRLRASAGVDVAALLKNIVLPLQASAGAASRRAQSVNHMKQLGLAMHNYVSSKNRIPPAVVIGPDGKTPHSWRVELLPYLEQQDLYNQYKMDEPWDSPSNRKVLEARPDLFGYPGSDDDPTHAAYFVVVGPSTIFPPDGKGTQVREITDGTTNTILVVEAKRPIPWTKPEDIPFDTDGPPPKFGGFQPELHGYNVTIGDGSVKFIKDTIDDSTLKALFTRNGGELISRDKF